MSLTLDTKEARKADNVSSSITESGKYIGVITRAEKLLSEKGTQGLGLSFRADDGATANYLDLYTENSAGEKLRGNGFVQAILCCTRSKNVDEGSIQFDKWDNNARQMIKASANGYPGLMGKRIGLVIQKEISTNTNTGADVNRTNVFAVFEADTELTASEILDSKTKPEQLEKIVTSLMARPVRDTRVKSASARPAAGAPDEFDDLPF